MLHEVAPVSHKQGPVSHKQLVIQFRGNSWDQCNVIEELFDFPFADGGVTTYIRRMGSKKYLVVRDTYLNHNRCQFEITLVTFAINFQAESTILEMQSLF